jgi:hypothetical protein
MPADDLVLNVRQIAGYPPVTSAPPSSTLLLQLAGLGSAYASISAADLVATALASGGAMSVSGQLSAQAFSGGSAQFSNAAVGMFTAQKACLVNFDAQTGTIRGVPIATTLDVAATVTSFNTRVGPITLWLEDILCAGGAPIYSPRFSGNPRAATPCPESNSTRLATTAYVTTALANVTLDFAPLDSPNFTGYATAPTAPAGTSDGQIATTAFVMTAVADSTTGVASFNTRTGHVVLTAADITGASGALLASPTFTGVPAAPTAAPATSTTQLATTAFVMAAVAAATAGVASFNGRTGVVTLTTADVAAVGVSSFNGRNGSVTLLANDVSAAGGALLASPIFTGTPQAPTATPGTNTAQLATTAYVMAALPVASTAAPLMNGTAAAGATTAWSRGDHVHPTDTSRYAASNPSNFQTAAQVTSSLAAYLPLSGGIITGGLNINVAAGASINVATSTGQPAYSITNPAYAPLGEFYYNMTSGDVGIYQVASGGVAFVDVGGAFNISGGTAYKPGGGSWTAPSDQRIKTVQGDYELGLAEVLRLEPVRFAYKGNDATRKGEPSPMRGALGQTFVGLIAQEVEAFFPGMVTKRAGFIDGAAVDDLRDLNVTELIFALVNAVKTLAARVTTLEAAA